MNGRGLSVGVLASVYAANTVESVIWTLWDRSQLLGLRQSLVDTVPNRGTVLLLAAASVVLAVGTVGLWARRCLMAAMVAGLVQLVIGGAGLLGWVVSGDRPAARVGMDRLIGVAYVAAAVLATVVALGWADRRVELASEGAPDEADGLAAG